MYSSFLFFRFEVSGSERTYTFRVLIGLPHTGGGTTKRVPATTGCIYVPCPLLLHRNALKPDSLFVMSESCMEKILAAMNGVVFNYIFVNTY